MQPLPLWRRHRILITAGVVLVALLAFVLVYFQPQRIFIDDIVDQAAPADAVAITAPSAPATTSAPAAPAAPAATTVTVTPTTAPAIPSSELATTAPTVATTTNPPAPVTTVPVIVAPAPAFFSKAHDTSGTVELLEDGNGTRFVRIVDLRTENGPDVKVYLSAAPPDAPDSDVKSDYVSLGTLQGNIGSQNYEVPADVELSRFRSVVIWCERFSVGFGAAPLP